MTDTAQSWMRREIDEIPQAARRLSTPGGIAAIRSAAAALRDMAPTSLVTVARGSSDHAATYLAYAATVALGVPVASIGPSLVTVHGAPLRMRGGAALAVSQSGASADILATARAIGAAGGHVIALTNTPDSPLAAAAGGVIDIAAGPERAVAATKSFVNSVIAGLWLIADWAGDDPLRRALLALPDALAERRDPPGLEALADAVDTGGHAMVLARGPALGLAGEIALKLMETCHIPALAFSGAEALHGPRALVSQRFAVLALTSGARGGMDQALSQLRAQGAALTVLPPATATGHPLVDPLLDVPAVYRMVEALSRRRGLDPDRPRHLDKETTTL